MARIRTIKPGFWTDEDLCRLPESTHMFAAALLNYADDDGYFNANPALIKGALYPLREPSVSIHDSLTALSNIGWIQIGRAEDGRIYGLIKTFSVHQRINRKTDSKIKDLKISWDGSLSTHGVLSEASLPEGNKEGNKEGKGKENRAAARAADAYAFSGEVIRLNQRHFDLWTKAYPELNLLAELIARDAWLSSSEATDDDRKKWFISTPQLLANRAMKAKAMGKYEKPMSVEARVEQEALRGLINWSPPQQ